MVDPLISHSIYVNRYGAGLYKDLIPHLKALRDRLTTKILLATDFQKQRLSTMIQEINLIVDDGLKPLNPDLFDEFIDYEAEFNTNLLNKYTNSSAVISEGLNVAAMSEFIKTKSKLTLGNEKPQTINQLINTFSKAYKKDIRNELEFGIAEDETTQQMAKRIQSLSDNRTRQQAEAVVRTVTNHVSNQVRQEVYKENSDIIEYETFISILDSRTTPICQSLSGKHFKVGEGSVPPLHFNCLTGDTLVSTRYPISYISKRLYEGDIYIINTSRGNSIRCTPNHPILTDRGFINAKSITKFDKIATDRVGKGIRFLDNQNSEGVSTIENLFSSLEKTLGVSTMTMPVTAKDFHSDVTDNKVDVISIERELFFKDYPSTSKHISKSFFINAYNSTSRFSKFMQTIIRHNPAFIKSMSFFNLIFSLFNSHKRPFNLFLLRLTSNFNSIINKFFSKKFNWNIHSFSDSSDSNSMFIKSYATFKNIHSIRPVAKLIWYCSTFFNNSINDFVRDIKLFSNISNGSLGDSILFDDVVNITITKNSSTHVYNLENDLGYYTANNLITHNCRSTRIPKIEADFMRDLELTQSSEGGYVPAEWDYNKWLSNQSNEKQNEILGTARAKAYRKSGIPINKFVDKRGKYYTLKQLKQKDLIE